MGSAGLGESGINRSVVGDVAFAEHAAKFLGHGFALFSLKVENGDLHALGSQSAGSGSAKARSTAGNNGGNSVVENHFSSSLSSSSRN